MAEETPGVEIRGGTVDAEREGDVGATDAERACDEGATDAERLIPRRERGEAMLAMYDGEEVGDATRELGGDADDRDALDKPV